jgi:hypothetical protein
VQTIRLVDYRLDDGIEDLAAVHADADVIADVGSDSDITTLSERRNSQFSDGNPSGNGNEKRKHTKEYDG